MTSVQPRWCSTSDLLLVDDDSDVVEVLEDILRSEGYRVRVAKNGLEGMEALKDKLPDLILLDVNMPVMDGMGMACRIFIEDAGKERIPILLLSGMEGLRSVAARIGTTYQLAKPYALGDLLKLIQRALEERIAPTFQDMRGGPHGSECVDKQSRTPAPEAAVALAQVRTRQRQLKPG